MTIHFCWHVSIYEFINRVHPLLDEPYRELLKWVRHIELQTDVLPPWRSGRDVIEFEIIRDTYYPLTIHSQTWKAVGTESTGLTLIVELRLPPDNGCLSWEAWMEFVEGRIDAL